jgi:hypothetical protein
LAGLRVLSTSLTGLGLQLLTYGLSWFTSGTSGSVPQPAISIGPTWTSEIIALIARVLPSVSSLTWMPTIVNLVAGWAILGLALLGLLSLLPKILAVVLVLIVVAVFCVLAFGIPIPGIPVTPSNSTSTTHTILQLLIFLLVKPRFG